MEPEFDECYQLLLEKFPKKWGLPRRILSRMERRDAEVPRADLCALACESAQLPGLQPKDFTRIVDHALGVIRAAAIQLVIEFKNPRALTLGRDDPVRWVEDREGMDRLLANSVLVPAEEPAENAPGPVPPVGGT
jgi:hypothetical protein